MRLDRGILLALVGVLLLVTLMLVQPYAQFVVGAILLAFVLRPLQVRLADRIGPNVSASLLVFASVLAVVVPVVLILGMVAGDAMSVAQGLQAYSVDYDQIETWIEEYTGQSVDVRNLIESAGQNLAEGLLGGARDVVETATHLLLGVGLFVFLLYFFVRDGGKLRSWLGEVSPMPDEVTEGLLQRLDEITRAVLAGHVLVAVIQGVLAGIGLVVVGIPNATFWTFMMIVLALIPIIGTFVVWGPAAIYLFLEGSLVAAAGLAIYGTIVVGVSDDYLRPVVTDRYAQVSPAAIIVGVIGGLSVFGFVGLFVGPIVIAALKETVEVYARYYGKEAEPTDG